MILSLQFICWVWWKWWVAARLGCGPTSRQKINTQTQVFNHRFSSSRYLQSYHQQFNHFYSRLWLQNIWWSLHQLPGYCWWTTCSVQTSSCVQYWRVQCTESICLIFIFNIECHLAIVEIVSLRSSFAVSSKSWVEQWSNSISKQRIEVEL